MFKIQLFFFKIIFTIFKIGHPFGMTGSRQVGHLARELRRRNGKYGIVTMCVGGGMGATGLFESIPE